MKRTSLLILLLVGISYSNLSAAVISLAGEWRFAIDRNDLGINERWFKQLPAETITLPGSMTTNGKGDDITVETPWTGQIVDSSWFKADRYARYRAPGNVKIAAWLQPVKYYKGPAWYIREFEITPEMAGKELEINLERVHWESTLWIDGRMVGSCNSLGTPHRYTLEPLKKGRHTIALRIDNRIKDIDMGYNAHSVSDHTQSNWNGVVGDMSIRSLDPVRIKNVAIYPDPDSGVARAEISIENQSGADQNVALRIDVASKFTPTQHLPAPVEQQVKAGPGVTKHTVNYPMGDEFYRWDEFTPYLYAMNVSLGDGAAATYDFGMRKFEARGKRLFINDRPIFLRGTLECAIFPKTGYPAMDEAEWARIFNICKAHGLNHVRFHSWCPPRAAFTAADRLGVYLQVEGGGWCTVGNGNEFDRWIYTESDRILAEYGNHPSFVLYAYGNEPNGDNQAIFLGGLVDYLKSVDTRHLYTSAAGWPMVESNEYRNDMYPRLKLWGTPCLLNTEAPRHDYQFDDMVSKCSVPWVSHEIGQWCVYPDFKEINMYDDAVLQPKNFEIFRETLAESGLASLGERYLMASGKLQTLLYKAEIESAMRTRDFGGYQLLDLHDFPGQGTALVGVLNPFWESKGYVTAEEYHQFSSATVPLVRTDRVIFESCDTLSIPVEISHFGRERMVGVVPSWTLQRADGSIYASGNLPRQDVELGNCIPLGNISQPLSASTVAEQLTLTVAVGDGLNSWDFWVYPHRTADSAPHSGTRVSDTLDAATLKYITDGGSVLLTPKRGALKAEYGGNVKSGFTTIFWNSAWTSRAQPPLTLGLLIDTAWGGVQEFPTEYHSNYQWYNAITDANIVNLSALGSDIDPAVRVIDDWFENRSLGLIFEARVGAGKLIFCGTDLVTDINSKPEMRQLRESILNYMASDAFRPTEEMESGKLVSMFK